MLTLEEFKQALPKTLRAVASQEMVDKLNGMTSDPDVAEAVRNNFISYTGVLLDGKFKTEDYISAIGYVSYKLMGHTNQEAYKRTFPKRYTTMKARGASDKEISAYVAAYSKNKLVNLVLEQTLVPTWVLNQDLYQAAINQQAFLMMNANSEKVRSDAANSILTHLKRPEVKQMEVSLGIAEPAGLGELKAMLNSMAQTQQDLIGQGVTTREIAHQDLGKKINQVEEAEIVEPVKQSTPKPVQAKQVANKFPLTSFIPGSTNDSI